MQTINKIIYDLHCHSTASDGALSPTEVVKRAHEKGVHHLALTDHDTVNGIHEAQRAAQHTKINLIPGIELSASWENKCLHIIGLGIDPSHPVLLQGIESQQNIRCDRAKKIAFKLEKKRIFGAYDAVKASAMDGMITRSHFAQFLVKNQHARDLQNAFDKYLGHGKPAYVSTVWADLPHVIDWIKQSGGIAVIAHPLRYNLTNRWMNRMLTAFTELGGQGIEVVTGRSNNDDIRRTHQYTQQYDLFASMGSDFHAPDQWVELGHLADLPIGSQPVWQLFD